MNMESHNQSWFGCFLAFILFASTVSSFPMAETHYHEFVIRATPVKRLCNTRSTITVNGQFPGPTLEVRNGDSLVVKVTNQAQYNATIHWHGIKQLRTAWADGPSFVTQCPIRPGGTYTYRFTIEQQEGTLWWHAHSSWLRATVYGALIIYPKLGTSYPFPKPNKEFSLLLGEWWNSDPIQVINQAVRTGGGPNVSDAYTINGQPGDFYNCSSQDTMIVPVQSGETNMLRIVNSAMNQLLFFTIANHQMTVVAADACYMKPFITSVIMLGPGQTTDVIIKTNQRPGNYYMASRAYASAQGGNVPFDNTTTTAILQYQPKAQTRPIRPTLPGYTDTNTVTAFDKKFRTLTIKTPVPTEIDEHLFFTIGLGLNPCRPGPNCQGPNNNSRFTASTSNISFVLPSTLSIIQSYYQKSPNKVFKSSFPAFPLKYDYTGNVPRPLWKPIPGTEALTLKYGSTVQLVLQDQKIYAAENHPIHLHGYSFYVVGTGFGNFDPKNDPAKFNLVDPPKRNTIGVPTGGWAVIRFKADNPGVWIMHCHIDTHLTWGLAMVFIVEDGIGELETLEPPPPDLPPC